MAAALADTHEPYADPVDFRVRLGRLDSAPALQAGEPPVYHVGDVQRFNIWAPSASTTSVNANLIYMNDVVAMWVEDGVSVNYGKLVLAANNFASVIYPAIRETFGEEWSPGIDNDPRITILNLKRIPGAVGYFGEYDEYPSEVYRDSNEREMIYVSLEYFDVGDEFYMATLAHEFQHMVEWHQDPGEELWVTEGLSQVAERVAGYDDTVISQNDFLSDTGVMLTNWGHGYADLNANHYGAAYLYMLYLREQLGNDVISAIAQNPRPGIEGIDAVLAGQNLTANEMFSRWIVANYLNRPDTTGGQFGYTTETLRPLCPRQYLNVYPAHRTGSLPQYSADYIEVQGDGTYSFSFQGQTETRIIPVDAHSGQSFWWSNRGDDRDNTLTRDFDLSGLDSATLDFWTWYDTDWHDYGYVMVSTDGGKSWDLLDGSSMHDDYNNLGKGYSGPSVSGGPEWIHQQIDLTPYAGQPVLLRFESKNEPTASGSGPMKRFHRKRG